MCVSIYFTEHKDRSPLEQRLEIEVALTRLTDGATAKAGRDLVLGCVP